MQKKVPLYNTYRDLEKFVGSCGISESPRLSIYEFAAVIYYSALILFTAVFVYHCNDWMKENGRTRGQKLVANFIIFSLSDITVQEKNIFFFKIETRYTSIKIKILI